MSTKLLTENRGPLQGVDLKSIVSSAYGPDAQYREDPDGVLAGIVVKPHGTGGKNSYDILDNVVELHEE